MNAAARAVNLTQPAITQALVRIENMLDAPLFQRRYDGMTPTCEALIFVPRIEAALAHIASPHVTMSRLRALLALADTGSYSAASLKTGLALPSLHRSVNDLALTMRRPLAERRGKSVILTETGTRVARSFRLARLELENGLAELEALKGRETRRVVIGAMPLARARVLPRVIARVLRQRPDVRISVVEGSRTELLEPFRNGLIDMMIGAQRDPLLEPDIVQEPLFRDRLVVIGRAAHPLAGCAPSVEELASYPWVVAAQGVPLRLSWEQMFERAGVKSPPVPVECGSVMTIRQLLVDSDFLALVSPDQVAAELEAGWLAYIADVPDKLERTIAVSTRASWRPTVVQVEFIAHLKDVARTD